MRRYAFIDACGAQWLAIEAQRRELMFTQYRRKQIAELRPFEYGETLEGISIADVDKQNGSPKAGDMIARNPVNHADQWLVSAEYFAANFEPLR